MEKTFDPAFEITFDSDDDPRSARSLPTWRKWTIVLMVSSTALCVACASSIYTAAIEQVMREFHASETVATLGLSMFVVGLALSPMLLGPLSEFYGRRPIYVVAMAFFVIWIIPCAVAGNMQTLIIARFFDGFAGATFLSIAGGTCGDLFPGSKLQKPMMIFTATPFLGPELGPVIGNFICYNTNWRWVFWVLLIWAALQWLCLVLFVPETYAPVLLRKEAVKKRNETQDARWHANIEKMNRSIPMTLVTSTYRPFQLLVFEPMVLLLCTFCALVLGILYLFFGAFNIVFSNVYGFNLWQVGLSFLGIFVGMILGILSDPFWQKNYLRLVRNHEKEAGVTEGAEPEHRLPPAILGAPLIVIGLLWFGWTSYPSIHWIVPIVGSAFFGCGVILVFSGIFTFLVAAYPLYAASALAANGFARSLFAAGFPLFGSAMYHNLRPQWATFVLAMITLTLAPLPFVFFKFGNAIRSRSTYAGPR